MFGIKMKTWGGRSTFTYIGNVHEGTTLFYGKNHRQKTIVTKADYRKLMAHFQGQTVRIGTSRTTPPQGSVGEWLIAQVTKTAIASYVGPILIADGVAERVADASDQIRFKRLENINTAQLSK
ncbi:hypothetical protein ACR6HW_03810 [Fusibacter sp. JL298sf-3]